jgi:hypothetical protein
MTAAADTVVAIPEGAEAEDGAEAEAEAVSSLRSAGTEVRWERWCGGSGGAVGAEVRWERCDRWVRGPA